MFSFDRRPSFTRIWLVLIVLILAALGGRLVDTALLILLLLTHEAAHLAVAAGLGCSVQGIALTPLGGMAGIGIDLAALPGVEALVALAGPLHHLFLALAIRAVPSFLAALGEHGGFFLRANLSLALFNLLPVYPLDGGRLLRAALAGGLGWAKATDLALKIGRGLSGVLIGSGLYLFWRGSGPLLFLSGAYLFFYAIPRQNDFMLAGQMRLLARKQARLAEGLGIRPRLLAVSAESPIWPILSRSGSRHYTLFCLLDRAGRPLGWIGEELALGEIARTGLTARFAALLKDGGEEICVPASNQIKK